MEVDGSFFALQHLLHVPVDDYVCARQVGGDDDALVLLKAPLHVAGCKFGGITLALSDSLVGQLQCEVARVVIVSARECSVQIRNLARDDKEVVFIDVDGVWDVWVRVAALERLSLNCDVGSVSAKKGFSISQSELTGYGHSHA